MSSSDALVVGEAWISEHYFTTDARSQSFQAKVLERRKEWDAEAAEGRASTRSRFTEVRARFQADFAEIGAALDKQAEEDVESAGRARRGPSADDAAELRTLTEAVHERLLAVLGLVGGHGLVLETDGPVTRVAPIGMTEGAPLAVVHATAVATIEEMLAKDGRTLAEPVERGDATLTSAARLVSSLFVDDDAPRLVLVLAGRWFLLAERERWAEGRYLAVDLQLVVERNDAKKGGEIDRALTCLDAASIAPNAEGDLWWTGVLEESVKHTVGVSQDLRDGVRASIEIIANEVVARRRDQGLDPLPGDQAQVLAKQSLRFLYRILFLLYAEASPELGVLPTGAPEYENGYSLDRLRDLVQVRLANPRAENGTHLYDSLGVLFRMVDSGHAGARTRGPDDEGGPVGSDGLTFHALRADLFRPEATAHLDEVGLGNRALQEVLAHLLLSKEKRGADRGFISYAELGINQLGAVYEGLMSYTGFFAETDLYEVAKGGDGSKGSWVVPTDRADGIDAADFVQREDPLTGQKRPVLHPRGSFVFRLAGRERQQSASYYTPEVLTRFTVGQALEELLDQDGTTTTAAEVLGLTVCEPALGSGAFAIEAVRQLAEQYLRRRQDETGERIDPDAYPLELQKVKAYLALHNVYGVDLNATAVELAEISLWLDTMVQGLHAPWFGLHLRRGNSLIGARRAVYRRDQVSDKSWLVDVPRDAPMTSLADDVGQGRVGGDLAGGIHHFLLPAAGWGAGADAKEAATLVPDAVKALKGWRSGIKAKPTKQQTDALVELAHRVEVLWQLAYQRLRIAELQVRRSIDVWGADDLPAGGRVSREQIEAALADVNGAYQRLRRVMDAWCALWFWPLTEQATTVETDDGAAAVKPPTLSQWIDGLQALLGRSPELRKRSLPGNQTLASALDWDELGDAEAAELGFAGARSVDVVLSEHPWLVVCERVARQQGFFHWELDFATVFARGGFDLQVGNPPWVRPRSDVDALLAEGDPWWQLALKPSEAQRAAKRAGTLTLPGITPLVVDGTTDVASLAAFLGDARQYPHLIGLQPDLYRCFMEQTWRHGAGRGTVGLIHPETHFTDEKARALRGATYLRLRQHWQFLNERILFEIDDKASFGIHVYSGAQAAPNFQMASYIYHPDVVLRSREHDGSGQEPGLKDPEGRWDLRPHRSRIITVTDETLTTWHEVLETPDVPVRQTRMVYAVNRSVAAVLDKLARAPRIGELGLKFSAGWHEKNDRTKGYFESSWGAPASWDDVILQGPHLFVANPMYKAPNRTMLHNQDWSAVDLETLAPDAIPVTAYKPAGDDYEYDCAYTDWGTESDPKPARDYYRIAWRNMAANANERTLFAAVVPPGAAHIHGITSAGGAGLSGRALALAAGAASALASDFSLRVAPKSTISGQSFSRLPLPRGALEAGIVLRSLRLNAVTSAYSDWWADCYGEDFESDSWTDAPPGSGPLAVHSREWTDAVPLRSALERRQALTELDALVGLALGLTADEICVVYRTQFAVLYGYDRNVYFYDANGRLVPNSVLTVWRKKGDRITADERTATNQAGNTYTHELPFATRDREADMRQAYAEFERRLAERS